MIRKTVIVKMIDAMYHALGEELLELVFILWEAESFEELWGALWVFLRSFTFPVERIALQDVSNGR